MKKYMQLKIQKDLSGDDKPFYSYVVSNKEQGNDIYEKEILKGLNISSHTTLGDIGYFKRKNERKSLCIGLFPVRTKTFITGGVRTKEDTIRVIIFPKGQGDKIDFSNTFHILVEFQDNECYGYLHYYFNSGFVSKKIYDIIVDYIEKEYEFKFDYVMPERSKTLSKENFKINPLGTLFYAVKID